MVAQILVPFAATLAGDEERGRVVGTVMGGLLLGILLARTLSGAIASVGGWRSVFVVAAVLMVVLAYAPPFADGAPRSTCPWPTPTGLASAASRSVTPFSSPGSQARMCTSSTAHAHG